jgi:hypothetical protein
MTEVRVACTWGDGPDVLLTVEQDGKTTFVDMTAEQAKGLAIKLQICAGYSDELDRIAEGVYLEEKDAQLLVSL